MIRFGEIFVTAINASNYNKKEALTSLCLFGRNIANEIITFFKENRGYYYIPELRQI